MALVKYNNNSLSAITSTGLSAGAMTLIKEQTASSSATISFVNGTSDVVLDSTYPIYVFKFINVHPASDQVDFQVNFRDGGSSYDATKTTTMFKAYHDEGDSDTALGYDTNRDLAQATGVQPLVFSVGNGNDESASGELWLYNPSSTTYVKHFMARTNFLYFQNYSIDTFVAGYCNVTAAIDGVQFSMSSGNIDAGTFKLYGIKDS
jgi:hypothetical protein